MVVPGKKVESSRLKTSASTVDQRSTQIIPGLVPEKEDYSAIRSSELRKTLIQAVRFGQRGAVRLLSSLASEEALKSFRNGSGSMDCCPST